MFEFGKKTRDVRLTEKEIWELRNNMSRSELRFLIKDNDKPKMTECGMQCAWRNYLCIMKIRKDETKRIKTS